MQRKNLALNYSQVARKLREIRRKRTNITREYNRVLVKDIV